MTQTAKDKLEEARRKAKENVGKEKNENTESGGKQAYVNTCEFSGRLTRDNELHFTPSGTELCKGAIAIWQPGKDTPTMFLDLTLWHNDDASKDEFNTPVVEQFLLGEKGQEVVVRGRLAMREYEGKRYFSLVVRDIALGAKSTKQ